MALRSFNPVTPSLRGTILVRRDELWKGKPVKTLTEGKHSSGGRNNHGRTTVRFRGGGHKRTYRLVDFKRRAKFGVPATVERLEYDPNRTAWIALLKYQDGELSYIIAPQRLKAGDSVVAGERVDIKPGNAMPLAAIPVGTIVHNVELKAGRRRQDGALGRHLRAARRQGRGLRAAQADVGRGAHRARRVHGDDRRGVQPGQLEPADRQGGPLALARAPAAQPRRGDEPGRPSRMAAARAAPAAAATR